MMDVNVIKSENTTQFQLKQVPDQVSEARKQKDDQVQSEQVQKNRVQPEELLNQIKALTEDGIFSVRFEKDQETDTLVVKVVDRESGDVIRQVPPEELLSLSKRLRELQGNIVNTQG